MADLQRIRTELLAEEARLLDARAHVNPRAKGYLDDAARRIRAIALALDVDDEVVAAAGEPAP